MLAPICLFIYNRVKEVQQTIDALRKNYLSNESDLYIFSDGPRNEGDFVKIHEVRAYINSISGFRSMKVFQSDVNKGLARSIISGVTKIVKKYTKVIVLEDDLITSPNFLDFMNQSLTFYESVPNIFSISGYTLDLPSLRKYDKDFYLGYRASSWGWASWQNRWETVDWEVKDYSKFKYSIFQKIKFMRGGSDLPGMLRNQMNGRIDSWAIRWVFNQFQRNMLTVYPSVSKLVNVGFGETATHTKRNKRFGTKLDEGNQRTFSFNEYLEIDRILAKEFSRKFSVINRIGQKMYLK